MRGRPRRVKALLKLCLHSADAQPLPKAELGLPRERWLRIQSLPYLLLEPAEMVAVINRLQNMLLAVRDAKMQELQGTLD